MNAQRPPISKTLAEVLADAVPDQKDQTIAVLEGQIGDLTNKHYEERFIWILICIVLIDALIFSHMSNWTAPLVIGVFELIAVVILADRYKVDTVAPLIDRLTGFFHKVAKVRPAAKIGKLTHYPRLEPASVGGLVPASHRRRLDRVLAEGIQVTKVLITVLLEPKDVPSFAQAANQSMPHRYPSFSSTVESLDAETLAVVLADHAQKLSQFGGGKAEER